ncbi:alanine--tRNA ligase [Candidatus Woesebacteria bacterium]|nr:alanine--tRNA ligase [Candidatus Woesebacteria bacterium]
MKLNEVREKYLKFFKASPRDHKEIKPAPLILSDDPTTLFTSSGMQPLVPYLLGEKHPMGKRLVNSQPSFRTVDIEEVGDNRHTTFFEMLGNWSLGDYFKKDQFAWFFEFLTSEIGLSKEKLWISVFEGSKQVPRDTESSEIWKSLGIPESHIGYYGAEKNWWSRNGTPDEMPVGDIGGPDSEVFYDFGEDLKIHENSIYAKQKCHMNCNCGRFLEIGNSVFMQYKKVGEGKLEELPNKNVDFGGGLLRIAAAAIESPDVFNTNVFKSAIEVIEKHTGKFYFENENKAPMRIIADHLRGAAFILASGVEPSNKLQGYIARRLIRRAVYKLKVLGFEIGDGTISAFIKSYADEYDEIKNNWLQIKDSLNIEAVKFGKALAKGEKKLRKFMEKGTLSAEEIFDLYQTEGFPIELTLEIAVSENIKVSDSVEAEISKQFKSHKDKSKTTSAGVFKGGLVDKSEDTVRLHTATHLLQAVLREVLGNHVIQRGQNINSQRSRFDFTHDKKLTEAELEKVESLINEIIKKDLSVNKLEMKKSDAEKTGAIQAFGEKYGDSVIIHYVGETLKSAFSKEFCGGPHVSRTSDIGRVKIIKQEKIGASTLRVYLSKSK